MTNTINNVPRELKPCPFCGDIPSENSHALTDGGFKYGAIQCGCGALGPDVRTEYKDWPHWRDAAFAAWNERALLSAPSPAGAGGLEVIGWYTDDHLNDKSATTYSREVAGRWLAKGWTVTGIANADDAQAIIDGLLGDVAAQEETANQWRELALQFDRHRMTAMAHIRAAASGDKSAIEALGVFAALPPIPGHEITAEFDQQANRIGELEGLLRRAYEHSPIPLQCRIDAALSELPK